LSANSSEAKESGANCWRLWRQKPDSVAVNMLLWTPFPFRLPHFTKNIDTGKLLSSKNIHILGKDTIIQKNYFDLDLWR